MRKRTALLGIIALAATTFATGAPLAAQTDGGNAQPRDRHQIEAGEDRLGTAAPGLVANDPDEEVLVFIRLSEPSVVEASNAGMAISPDQQQQTVAAQQEQVKADLARRSIDIEEQSTLQVAANGIKAWVRAGDIPAIRASEEVISVAPVTEHVPLNQNSVPFIGADEVWPEATGDGTIIAVLDTGIDYTHAAMGGSGDPSDYEAIDPTADTPTFNSKVIDGYDFAGPVYDASSDDPDVNTPEPDANPLDVDGHGTHVSSSAAGLEVADGGETLVGSGVAPDAQLVALKVFGDTAGSSAVVADAIEWVMAYNIVNPEDPIDVINMSLGSDYGNPGDPSAIASQNAAEAGVVVVAASGNAGHTPYITSSPAIAPDAISVAASQAGGVEYLQVQVNLPEPALYDAQPAAFGDPLPGDPGITQDVVVTQPLDACFDDPTDTTQELDNAAEAAGNIVLIQRGICEFSDKVLRAENSGAVAVIVYNNAAGPPIAMGAGVNADEVTIPSVMIGLADGEELDAWATAGTAQVTLSADITTTKPEFDDTMAGFTSQGPGFGHVFKPEITAPGVSVYAAGVGTGNQAVPSSGTSMATPHVAGVAALLREQYPDLGVDGIKSLIMNSATPAALDPGLADPIPLSRQGVGRVNADRAALDVGAYTSPAGVSFGHSEATGPVTLTETVEVTALAGDPSYDLALEENLDIPGVEWSLSTGSVATEGGTASFDVTVDIDPSQLPPEDWFYSQQEADAWVVLTNDSDPADTMRVGLVAVADAASQLEASAPDGTVDLENANASAAGAAEAFTSLAGPSDGALDGFGWRTLPGTAESDLVEFGLALDEPFHSPSPFVVDVWIDVDGDGNDDYLLEAADVGLLQGADFAGQVATILVAVPSFDVVDFRFLTTTDFNDRVTVLTSFLSGTFGFLPDGDTDFTVDVVYGDLDGNILGLDEDIEVDTEAELGIAGPGPSVVVAPAGSVALDVEGEGDLLWLFPGNPVSDQAQVVAVVEAEEEPPAEEPPVEEAPPEEAPPSFDDVPDDHLFHTEITWLAEMDITRGCNPPDNTMFCPDDPVTRGQMAAFMNRALDLTATPEDFFVDDDESIFEGDIDRLAAADITRGCNPPDNDRYCPDDAVTRAQMASFMVRAFGFADGAGADLFVDDDGNVHEDQIDILGTANVTRGCNPPDNDRYCPDQDISRGQMAAFIYRAFQAAGLEG